MKHTLLLAFATGITIAHAQVNQDDIITDQNEYRTKLNSGDAPAIILAGAYYQAEKNNLPYFIQVKEV